MILAANHSPLECNPGIPRPGVIRNSASVESMSPLPRFLPETMRGHIRESGDRWTKAMRRAIIPPDAPTRGTCGGAVSPPSG